MCTFKILMNFPPLIIDVMYNKINDLMFNSCIKVANYNTLNAHKDACEKLLVKGHALNSDDQYVYWAVSGGGLWLRRGHKKEMVTSTFKKWTIKENQAEGNKSSYSAV